MEFESGGTFVTGIRGSDNFWTCPTCSYSLQVAVSVRLTGVNNEVISDRVQPMGLDGAEISGLNQVQFTTLANTVSTKSLQKQIPSSGGFNAIIDYTTVEPSVIVITLFSNVTNQVYGNGLLRVNAPAVAQALVPVKQDSILDPQLLLRVAITPSRVYDQGGNIIYDNIQTQEVTLLPRDPPPAPPTTSVLIRSGSSWPDIPPSNGSFSVRIQYEAAESCVIEVDLMHKQQLYTYGRGYSSVFAGSRSVSTISVTIDLPPIPSQDMYLVAWMVPVKQYNTLNARSLALSEFTDTIGPQSSAAVTTGDSNPDWILPVVLAVVGVIVLIIIIIVVICCCKAKGPEEKA